MQLARMLFLFILLCGSASAKETKCVILSVEPYQLEGMGMKTVRVKSKPGKVFLKAPVGVNNADLVAAFGARTDDNYAGITYPCNGEKTAVPDLRSYLLKQKLRK